MRKFFNPAIQTSRSLSPLRISVLLVLFHLPVSIASAQALIRTVAGGVTPVSGGLAITQNFQYPAGVISDGAGGFYFTSGSKVYRVTADGITTVIAGKETPGFSGDGGPATSAQLSEPHGLALARDGNLFIADAYDERIRKVTPAGTISTVAGAGYTGRGGDGGPATAARIRTSNIAVDGADNLYFPDTVSTFVRKVSPSGIITTVSGSVDGNSAIALDGAGNIYYAGPFGSAIGIRKFTPSGSLTTIAGTAFDVSGIAVDANSNLFIADRSRDRVWKRSPNGVLSVVAGVGTRGFSGDGGPAVFAEISGPESVAVDPEGNLFIADSNNNRIRKVSPDGTIRTVAGTGEDTHSGDGGPATLAGLGFPTGLAFDKNGNLFVADSNLSFQEGGPGLPENGKIRKITPSGVINTIAGIGGPSLAVDGVGDLFVADTDGGRILKSDPAGLISTVGNKLWYFFDYDGFGLIGEVCITGMTIDAQGNLYVAETATSGIWKVTPSGVATVFASVGPLQNGLAMDGNGNLYVADSKSNRIRKVTPAGIITTVAGNGGAGFGGDGGPATSAQLRYPLGVAVDKDGNLFIADSHNNRIRKVDTAGIITTVAGNGTSGFSGDGGAATLAMLDYPAAVAVDGSGNLFIADSSNNRIREVFLALPVLFGISTEAGFLGTSVNVTLTGVNFTGETTIDEIPGVTISNVQVVNSNTITAAFSIDPSASPGSRRVTVTGPSGTSAAALFTLNAFTIPSVAGISPVRGAAGESLAVTLTGSSFVSGMTIDPGAGIRVSNISVLNPNLASATFAIDSDAIVGGRLITVSTNLGISNTVTFSVTTPLLTVLKSGTGSGNVTSSPAGILCGDTCSTTFTHGQIFTLTAIPDADSIFAGWSGNADCNDGVVTMDAARNCVARFDRPQSNSTLLRGDFDGDGKTDIAVYRPTTGEWLLRLSTQNYGVELGTWYFQWGLPGDLPVIGDFDGDRRTDIAVYRPSTGEWFLRLSSRNYEMGAGNWYFQWGLKGDIPVAGDFDGDGKTDIAVYRPSSGEWLLRLSKTGYAPAIGNWYFQWGMPGDVPITGDFDGDGKADISVYRPSTGEWFLRLSTQGYLIAVENWYFQWGVNGDQPVAGDFDGDGKTDIAVYRPSTGEWFLRLSTQGYAVGSGNWYFQWGLSDDRPIASDFDGDGKTDVAVYRTPSGEWFLRRSTLNFTYGGANSYFQWGLPGDLSLPR